MGKLLKGVTDGDSVTSIYKDYNPAYKNLYTVEIYYFSENHVNDKSSGWVDTDDISKYIKFHATNVTFGDETLNLDRNPITKNFQLKSSDSYTRSDRLSITWREADDWLVKKYHEKWVGSIYNKEEDYYWSYPRTVKIGDWGYEENVDSLYRKIRIILPASQWRISITPYYYKHIIVFEDVLPCNIGKLDFSWDSNSEIIKHQLDYYVKSWHWENEQV